MPQILIENFTTTEPISCSGGGLQPGDIARLFLNQTANPGFPEFVDSVVQFPIEEYSSVVGGCLSPIYRYSFIYDSDSIVDTEAVIQPYDILTIECKTCCSILNEALEAETSRAIAAELVETTARAEQDQILQENIDAETQAREDSDTVISQGLADETAARVAQDSDIADELGDIQSSLTLLAPALVDWQFNGWDGTSAIASKGATDLPITMTLATEIEGSAGYGRQMNLDGTSSYGLIADKLIFDRVHDGRQFTLLLEGERLAASTDSASALMGTSSSVSGVGFVLNNVTGSLSFIVQGVGAVVTAFTGTLVRIRINRVGNLVSVRATSSTGAVFNGSGNISPLAGTSTDFLQYGRQGVSHNFFSNQKISRLRLFDRAL